MPLTRYDAGTTGFSSTFIFTNVILSPCSAASSSRMGATWRHGPHHSAQKSTRTGLSDLSTVDSKSASVTAARFATGDPSCWTQPQTGCETGAPGGVTEVNTIAPTDVPRRDAVVQRPAVLTVSLPADPATACWASPPVAALWSSSAT